MSTRSDGDKLDCEDIVMLQDTRFTAQGGDVVKKLCCYLLADRNVSRVLTFVVVLHGPSHPPEPRIQECLIFTELQNNCTLGMEDACFRRRCLCCCCSVLQCCVPFHLLWNYRIPPRHAMRAWYLRNRGPDCFVKNKAHACDCIPSLRRHCSELIQVDSLDAFELSHVFIKCVE